MKKQVIAYIHSHWDREWYREYEVFRLRLLRVFDNILYMLEKELIPSFYFDGQTAALLDYLEIRPEKEEQIKKLIKNKKLFIGPFYCLVDEFLTDENCFRKNIELGLKTAKEFGCEDFAGYFADTFGHSASVIPILNDYGINTTVVWRGCPENIRAEFTWQFKTKFQESSINTLNLVRGYFNDIFSADLNINQKAEFLKNNLDKIADKSGDILLLPVGADHLGVEYNLPEQIEEINKLIDDYEIKLGSIFEYIEKVQNNFKKQIYEGELRDNSNTFILEGCYSSRLDLKKYNITACHDLYKVEKLVKYFGLESKYKNIIDYAYKLLLQNQAHDSICGCSTDNVHSENIIRYKKINQITDTITEEIRFYNGYNLDKVVNLFDSDYQGAVEFNSEKDYPYQIIDSKKDFPPELYANTQKIPITEDYTDIYTYLLKIDTKKNCIENIKPDISENDVFITDKCIGNSKIFLSVENGTIKIGDKTVFIIDYNDAGDSYNTGYIENDTGIKGEIISSKILMKGAIRATLGIDIKLNNDLLHLKVSLDKYSDILNFEINWNNSSKNHLTEFVIDTQKLITETDSEDFDNIIKRYFDPNYDVRKNLPKEKGNEVKTNNAPMHRGVMANGAGFVTCGLTQYEVYKTELRIPILRATGTISNPYNTSRTTPAGPPVKTSDLQQLGINSVNFSVFLGDDLANKISQIYNGCVVI